MDVKEWLDMRNRVLIHFLLGATSADIERSQGAFKFGRIVEDVYGIGQEKLVCPLGFMENLSIYTTRASMMQ